LNHVFDIEPPLDDDYGFDSDPALPGQLWDPAQSKGVEGGKAYGENSSEEGDNNDRHDS